MPEESVADYAEREGISPRRVRELIGAGRLPARQVGRQWLVDQASVHRPAQSRPLGVQMRAGLIALLSGLPPPELSASERHRLRTYFSQLLGAEHPDQILAAWVPQKPVLRLAVAPSDMDDLRRDIRVVRSGFSDPRSQIAAAGQLEVRVAGIDLDSLRREYLLRPSDAPNVFVHVTEGREESPLPLGRLLVDLAHHNGVRERSRVAELLKEVSL